MDEITFPSSSPEDTRALAAAVARVVRPGDVIVLSGDLGAGKTCFVQGAAWALGVTAGVTSPSFVLVREYAGAIRIVHADVYRLNSLNELFDLGYEDLFAADAVAFIEWGDAVDRALPPDRLEVTLRRDPNGERRMITLRAVGPSWESRLPLVSTSIADGRAS